MRTCTEPPVRPLYVTARFAVPTGVFDGKMAATWVADVYTIIASTAVVPAVTLIEVPASAIGRGKAAWTRSAGPRRAPNTRNMEPCAKAELGKPGGG